MIKLKAFSLFIALSLSSSTLFGAALVVAFDSGGAVLRNASGGDLPSGSASGSFDGAIIQLGYFSGATSDNNNFSGTFTALSGEGSVNYVSNTVWDTTVGDDPTRGFAPLNQFNISLTFDTNIQVNLPAVGTILSIRVYDNTSTVTSSSFMTLSSNSWKWKQPSSPTDPSARLDLSFADTGLRRENRSGVGGLTSSPSGDAVTFGSSLQTDIAIVPEPTIGALIACGLVSMAFRRPRVS